MKLINKLSLVFIIGILISFSSCEDYFGDVNIDPDNPTVVTPNVLLPQVEARLAYVVGGDASRYIGIYTQQIDGVGRQFAVLQNYGIQPGDVDNMWGQNLYSGVLMDNRQLLALAETGASSGSFNHYSGVSKAIEAYSMMLLTDMWGDAPYTESFQGLNLLQPKFDSQESIYNAVFSLIEESRTLFASDDGGFAPGADDLIYGGDIAKWGAFLNVLEARGRLHLGKVDAANYQRALDALSKGGFTSSGDDALFQFGLGATEAAPWYQYIEQRDDIEVGGTYVSIMEGLNDPRVATYGALQDLPHPILVADRAFPLLTYTEMKFIEAEALLQTGGDPTQAYLDAIGSSFVEAQVEGVEDYVAQTSVATASLENIITQKYIALFNDPEVFNDWRRTGIPELTPNTPPSVPRRLPYSDNAIKSNPNTPSPASVTIHSRVWWDTE